MYPINIVPLHVWVLRFVNDPRDLLEEMKYARQKNVWGRAKNRSFGERAVVDP